MTAAPLRRAPLSVSDRRVLLSVSEAQAGPRATVSGSTEGQRSFWHARPADTYYDPMMAAPGLRAEWDAGDHSGHHRYQNTGHSQRAGAGRAQAMS